MVLLEAAFLIIHVVELFELEQIVRLERVAAATERVSVLFLEKHVLAERVRHKLVAAVCPQLLRAFAIAIAVE